MSMVPVLFRIVPLTFSFTLMSLRSRLLAWFSLRRWQDVYNNNEDFYSTHLLHKVEAQDAL